MHTGCLKEQSDKKSAVFLLTRDAPVIRIAHVPGGTDAHGSHGAAAAPAVDLVAALGVLAAAVHH